MLAFDNQTIVAQCTPKGPGALALLRFSGDDARLVVSAFSRLVGNKDLITVPTHTIHYGSIKDHSGTIIDKVLFFVMDGPQSFTGQNTIEITCHNNPFIIQEIIKLAITHGARLAQEGEFSKRAVCNNKIDLLQAEAIHELIQANTQEGLKRSLAQMEGTLSYWIAELEKQLIKALALSDASFEFLDEEGMEFGGEILQIITSVYEKIQTIITTYGNQKHIRQGYRIALIGAVNAGKSSLFNALLQQNRAIVSKIAGTTRDVIEAGIYHEGNYWTIIDTAGLRSTNDLIEKEGITRSLEEAKKADIILLIYDGSRTVTPQEQEFYNNLLMLYPNNIICIRNKMDLPTIATRLLEHQSELPTSYNNKESIQLLLSKIQALITQQITNNNSPYLLNTRHFGLLLKVGKKLEALLALINNTPQYEIISHELKDSLGILGEMTGKTASEAGMDAIFREFCIGK